MSCISGDSLQGVVFVRLQLCCTTPVEQAYYAAASITRKDICCYCAEPNSERDPEALLCYPCVRHAVILEKMWSKDSLRKTRKHGTETLTL